MANQPDLSKFKLAPDAPRGCNATDLYPDIRSQNIITRLKFSYKLLFSGTGTQYTTPLVYIYDASEDINYKIQLSSGI